MKYRYRWVTAWLHLNGDVRATEVKRNDGCLFIIAENIVFNLDFTDQTIETNVINPLSLIICDLPFTKEIPSNHRNTDMYKKKKIDFNHSLIAFFLLSFLLHLAVCRALLRLPTLTHVTVPLKILIS